MTRPLLIAPLIAAMTAGCGDNIRAWECTLEAGSDPAFAREIGCRADFQTLASLPLDARLPGARSVKTVIDRADGGALYFQNSLRYQTHHEFASAELSGNGLPVVPMLAEFSATEYSSPSRRFVLGALTFYEGPDVFVYELAPYDGATADLIEYAYRVLARRFYDDLYFHPTSSSLEVVAQELEGRVPVITSAELYAGIDYQALNVAESYGQLRFFTAEELDDSFVTFRDIVVLDSVPNDISAVVGIITAEFQTPLSHVNVLSQNRGTPNMALRGAHDDPVLRALEGEWVRLRVDPFDYSIDRVTRAEADAWWEQNKPSAVQVPGLDLTATDLRDVEAVIDLDSEELGPAIKSGTRAYGGKAAHYSALARIEGVRSPQAFAVPVVYYRQFMEQNGFDQVVLDMLSDPTFQSSAAERDRQLRSLRAAMRAAPVDSDFEAALAAKLRDEYPDQRMRFRSSTNAEDLDGFTGAGLYTSRSGELADPESPVMDAVRAVWASIWNYRAFEERSYRSIDHLAVGMALLVHRSFPDEEANGVALTNNPFDTSGLESAFYVNVQLGETPVVQPPPGITSDQIIYHFDRPGQPTIYVAHSSLVADGSTVMTRAQLFELGEDLAAIRSYFAGTYSPPPGSDSPWWAMDVEFKLDGDVGEEPQLFVKQVRPFGGR